MNLFDSRQADELATLLALSEYGSFAAAGRKLQRHPSVLSKRLNALERRLGLRLVERTTRQLRFSEEGLRLIERLRQAASLIQDAQSEAASNSARVQGRLRIAVPATMGRLWLSPIIARFALAYPDVVMDVEYSERFVDIVAEGFDVAIRIGELANSRLVAKKLCNQRRILCASPSYLEDAGIPAAPEDLIHHNCLSFSGLHSFPNWKLTSGRRSATVRINGSITSNDNEALLAAARAGVGILAAGEWMLKNDFNAGLLTQVLPEWQLDIDAGIYFVRPSTRYSNATTEAFKLWIEEHFAFGPPWAVL